MGLAIEGVGTAYITGYADGPKDDDAFTVAGDRRWTAVHDRGSQDHTFAAAIDPRGGVAVGGQTFNGNDYDLLAVAYDAHGVQRGRTRGTGGRSRRTAVASATSGTP